MGKCKLYMRRGFSNGNAKCGNVEWAFGMKRAVAQHLSGSDVLHNELFVGVAQSPTHVRLYGLEEKNIDALRALMPLDFECAGVFKTQPWAYKGGTVKHEQIGSNASVGGFLVASSKLPYWDDDPTKRRENIDTVTFGPGFVQYRTPTSLQCDHHGGRQVTFDPRARIKEFLSEAKVEWTESASGLHVHC